jgi:hypothetical protein
MSTATFQVGQLFSTSAPTATGKQIRALCAYEGTFTSMSGAKRKFTPALLQKLADDSNAHLSSGVQAPVFYTNHDYNPKDKAGLIVGPYEAKTITETDLPDPNLTDLVGKFGVFTMIELIREEAIADYEAKLIKPISMSVDWNGEHFTKGAIYEISLVGFGAIPGAQLFSKGKAMAIDFKALAQQALDLSAVHEKFGLTLSDQVAKEELMPKLYRLFDAFTTLIREIYEEDNPEATPESKDALIQQAIADLSVGIASRLRVGNGGSSFSLDPDDGNPPPEDETPPADEEDMSKIEDLQAQIAELKQTTELQEAYSALHAKAGVLVDGGYLTPALYKSDFEAESFGAKDIQAKFGGQGLGETLATIREKSIELNAIEKFSTPVRMGTRVHEPLEEVNQAEEEAESFMSSYSIKTPLGKY